MPLTSRAGHVQPFRALCAGDDRLEHSPSVLRIRLAAFIREFERLQSRKLYDRYRPLQSLANGGFGTVKLVQLRLNVSATIVLIQADCGQLGFVDRMTLLVGTGPSALLSELR